MEVDHMEFDQNAGLHRWSILLAFCTLLLVVAGGLVTSRDAGLSVPDWPLSYGKLMPPMEGGILYEHGHRMVATTVGLLTIVSVVWLFRSERRKWLRWLGVIALIAVVVLVDLDSARLSGPTLLRDDGGHGPVHCPLVG
jgi:cytochrome c oxidase assembly protein subunit 15